MEILQISTDNFDKVSGITAAKRLVLQQHLQGDFDGLVTAANPVTFLNDGLYGATELYLYPSTAPALTDAQKGAAAEVMFNGIFGLERQVETMSLPKNLEDAVVAFLAIPGVKTFRDAMDVSTTDVEAAAALDALRTVEQGLSTNGTNRDPAILGSLDTIYKNVFPVDDTVLPAGDQLSIQDFLTYEYTRSGDIALSSILGQLGDHLRDVNRVVESLSVLNTMLSPIEFSTEVLIDFKGEIPAFADSFGFGLSGVVYDGAAPIAVAESGGLLRAGVDPDAYDAVSTLVELVQKKALDPGLEEVATRVVHQFYRYLFATRNNSHPDPSFGIALMDGFRFLQAQEQGEFGNFTALHTIGNVGIESQVAFGPIPDNMDTDLFPSNIPDKATFLATLDEGGSTWANARAAAWYNDEETHNSITQAIEFAKTSSDSAKAALRKTLFVYQHFMSSTGAIMDRTNSVIKTLAQAIR